MQTRVHISLEVADLNKSVDFYSKLFLHPASKVRVDYANFRLESPALHLALVHKPGRKKEPGPSEGSDRHYGIELFSDPDLHSYMEKAQAAGLKLRIEEDVTCCYATANKFWVQDPDGHEWEFWVKKADAETMHGEDEKEPKQKAQCCAPASCC